MGESTHCVVVSQRYPPEKGGNASRIHDTAVNLVDEHRSVTVLAPPPCYPPGNFEPSWTRSSVSREEGVAVRRLWSWQPRRENPGLARRLPYFLVFALHAAFWLLWNWRRYDVVLTSTPPITTGLPGFVAAALGKPWVVDVRDLWIENSVSLGYVSADSPLVTASRWFQYLVLHTVDRVTVTTATLGDAIAETYGEELRDRIRHVPNGVDTNLFAPTASATGGGDGWSEPEPRTNGGVARDEVGGDETGSGDTGSGGTDSSHEADSGDGIGDPAGGPVIVYTGNVGSAQALEPCIRAMGKLARDDAVLRIVGDGDDASRLRELTRRLGLDDRVEFVGLVDRGEVPKHINDAAVGLAPLRDTEELAYAMPTKAYEYLACRVPVLVTGRGEVRRFVEETGGGVHVDPDPEAIAAALDELLADDDRRREMGAAGHEHVVSTYDRGRIADRLGEELDLLPRASRDFAVSGPVPDD